MAEQMIRHSPIRIAQVALRNDLSTACERANPALGAMSGRAAADLLGEPITEIVAPEDASGLEGDMVAVSIGAAPGFTREVQILRPDGTALRTIWIAGVLPQARQDGVQIVINIVPAEASHHPHARLHRLAFQDRLTGLYNRAWLDEELAPPAQPRDEHRPGAVLMIDLDNLKTVNDAMGHEHGDRYLATAAAAMRDALRPTDALVRFGGDEFVALLPHTDVAGATSVARAVCRQLGLETVASTNGAMTASIGVAMFPSDTAVSGPDLIGRADAAMYLAKRGGKNRIVRDPGEEQPIGGYLHAGSTVMM